MRTLPTLLLCSALVFAGACKRNYSLETSAPATAGLAKITLDRDKTGNGTIDLSFEHLAAPKDIDPSLSGYVVWGQVEGKDPFKIGILEYREKKRTGKLSASYSDDQFMIIVTVEQDPGTPGPTGAKILELPVVAPKK